MGYVIKYLRVVIYFIEFKLCAATYNQCSYKLFVHSCIVFRSVEEVAIKHIVQENVTEKHVLYDNSSSCKIKFAHVIDYTNY